MMIPIQELLAVVSPSNTDLTTLRMKVGVQGSNGKVPTHHCSKKPKDGHIKEVRTIVSLYPHNPPPEVAELDARKDLRALISFIGESKSVVSTQLPKMQPTRPASFSLS